MSGGYHNEPSIFDGIKKDDLIIAFFPCTRFEAKVPLWFRGQAQQQKNWDDIKKLEYSMKLHDELHELYELISMLVVVAEKRGLQMIIENPYTQPHYLTSYWCIKPSMIDKNRRMDGDYFEKPTYKLTQFEFDLLNAHKDSGMQKCISNYRPLHELHEKGYFKDIDINIPIHEILDNCEVV